MRLLAVRQLQMCAAQSESEGVSQSYAAGMHATSVYANDDL